MDKVFQVFVSSTFSDLADERRQVTNTLAKAGYIAAGMELFPATDQQQLDFIKRVIDRSDYYVVIVAGRYGSLADDKLSFTEHEYEYAVSKGIPILAFLHAEPDKIETGKTDKDPDKAKSLDAFRAKLASGRIVDFWKTASDLCTTVLTAVVQTTNLFPATGWVRGDQAIDPKILQETEQLRGENSRLRQRIEELDDGEIRFAPNLPNPDDKVTISVELTHSGLDTTQTPAKQISRTEKFPTTVSIRDLFVKIYDSLLGEPIEYNVREVIAAAFKPETEFKYNYIIIPDDDIRALRYKLEAMGLIETFGSVTTSSLGHNTFTRSHIAWRPTQKGQKFVVQQRINQS